MIYLHQALFVFSFAVMFFWSVKIFCLLFGKTVDLPYLASSAGISVLFLYVSAFYQIWFWCFNGGFVTLFGWDLMRVFS